MLKKLKFPTSQFHSYSHPKVMLAIMSFCFSLGIQASLGGQTNIMLYTDEELKLAPGMKEEMRVHENGEHILTAVHKPEIIAYVPETSVQNKTAVIVIPGGGHREIWMDHEGHRIAAYLKSKGLAGFVLKYRLSAAKDSPYNLEEHSLKDALRAVTYVRAQAKELGVDPNKIGVMGFSAGGHLAGLTALKAKDDAEKPNFQALIYPGWIEQLQPNKTCPPAFLLAGAQDRIADLLPDLYLKYKALNIPAELHMLGKTGHGFGIRDNNAGPTKNWMDLFMTWLEVMGFD